MITTLPGSETEKETAGDDETAPASSIPRAAGGREAEVARIARAAMTARHPCALTPPRDDRPPKKAALTRTLQGTVEGCLGAAGRASRDEELALADDRLAVHFDGRAPDRVLEPERGLVVPAGEIIPADSDGDRPADDGVL